MCTPEHMATRQGEGDERQTWRCWRPSFSPCRLLVGVKVDEALAEAAAVVARGDGEQARHVLRRRDGRLRRRRDRGQVRAVDDDLLNAGDVRLEFRLRPELVAE